VNALFKGLYGTFVGLQVLDAHSTVRALKQGATERNPILASLIRDGGDPAVVLAASKLVAGAATLGLTELVRRDNPNAAANLMTVINAVYAGTVVHNYRIR